MMGVVNYIFWSEIGSEVGELGGTPPNNSEEFPGVLEPNLPRREWSPSYSSK